MGNFAKSGPFRFLFPLAKNKMSTRPKTLNVTFALKRFGHCEIVSSGILVLVINDGVVVTHKMFLHFCRWARVNNFKYLLIWKKNSYEYEFNAQWAIANYFGFSAVAVVVGNRLRDRIAYDTISGLTRNLSLTQRQLFFVYEDALHWLELELDKEK